MMQVGYQKMLKEKSESAHYQQLFFLFFLLIFLPPSYCWRLFSCLLVFVLCSSIYLSSPLSLGAHLLCQFLTSLFFFVCILSFSFSILFSSPSLSFSSCNPPRWPPPKKRRPKHHFAFIEKRTGVWPFPRTPCMGNCCVMLASTNKIIENPSLQGLKTNFYEHWHTIYGGHAVNPSKTPSPQIPIFIVHCSLHLCMKAQHLATISTHPFRNGPIYHNLSRHLHLQWPHTHQTPQKMRAQAWHHKCRQNALKHLFSLAKIDVDNWLILTWIVG